MADLPFKINVETVSGATHSWYTGSFAQTTEADISASVILTRIKTRMISSSYSSNANEPTDIYTQTFENNANLWLEASQVGNAATGSIKFTHTDGDDGADRLKRYRFFGTKVCNVLGLPEGQWTYPQNFHLDDSGGTNYFSGDVAATTLSLTHGLTLANTATVRSNLRFGIDKTADLFTQFTTGSGAFQSNGLLLGYNSDSDRYVLDKGDLNNLHIDATVVSGSTISCSTIKQIGSAVATGPKIVLSAGYLSFFSGHATLAFAWFASGTSPVPSFVVNPWQNDWDFNVLGHTANMIYGDADTNLVGFGQTTPLAKIHMKETADDRNGIIIEDDTSEMYIGMVNGSQKLTIGNGTTIGGGTPILTVDDANNRVGIQDDTPSYPLDVTGTIRATSNVIAYSDIRKKENVLKIENGLSLIEQLRGVRFDWKEEFHLKSNSDRDKRQVGLIAQEVEKVVPEVVFTDSDGYKSIAYSNLSAVLVEAIKDLKVIVDEQQEQIEKLKQQIEEI